MKTAQAEACGYKDGGETERVKDFLAVFEDFKIRRVYDEKTETWYFSVVDIIRALLQQPNFQLARNYWKVLKNRLHEEGSEVVTNCNRLKLPAEDGKMRFTDVASPETLLWLSQSVPSPKAEPIKLWLAKVGMNECRSWLIRKNHSIGPGKTGDGADAAPSGSSRG